MQCIFLKRRAQEAYTDRQAIVIESDQLSEKTEGRHKSTKTTKEKQRERRSPSLPPYSPRYIRSMHMRMPMNVCLPTPCLHSLHELCLLISLKSITSCLSESIQPTPLCMHGRSPIAK
mmetsp:Transcript_13102/g.25708  ORF Transcript_13102/g.25708 Transcript_13102/m.25708 type:complete len:118 (+) Transcript_13102:980-1333(+)